MITYPSVDPCMTMMTQPIGIALSFQSTAGRSDLRSMEIVEVSLHVVSLSICDTDCLPLYYT